MIITEFTEEWIGAAEELVWANYAEERRAVPVLPERTEIPSLSGLVKNGLGVAAVEGGELLGFLGAYGPWNPVFYTQSLCGVFSPVHAHAAVKENRIKIYRCMYQAAAKKWVAAGASSHAITLYAHDEKAREAFYLYGFGVRCMDLMRSTEPISVDTQYICRELPSTCQSEIHDLRVALSAHLSQSPCFMRDSEEDVERWIQKKENDPPRVFVAERDGRIAAYLEVTDEGENFASSSRGTQNICGAFCLPEYRGIGVAQEVLNYVLETLHREGYLRLGVDCESFNPTALGFWSKYFSAYTHSVVRRIDENALG